MLALPLVIMGPIMFLFLLKEKWYPYFFVLARIWAKLGLFGTGFYYKINREQKFEAKKSYMLILESNNL
jgi:1-acyl-sn-glycerol-3-phosphate acyltransferase